MNNNYILNTYSRFDVIFKKGKGMYLYDINGEEYFDLVSGIAVNCLGHSNPKIAETIEKQSKTLMHISNLYWSEPQLTLAEKLINLGGLKKVFFTNSGTEANELALKISRKFGKQFSKEKNKIIYMKNSFHGRTLGSLSVTGKKEYKEPYEPILGGVIECDFNNIKDFYLKFDKNVCGVIIELVQGEGGIKKIDLEFLKVIKNLCEINDALIITDDVQCGMGRIGTLFAYEKFGIVPDVITSAKGIGGGFPLGAVFVGEKAKETLKPGDHGSTCGGNPLACAVGNTIIDELVLNGVLKDVDKKSEYLKEKLNYLKNNYGVIDEIRGMGLILGLKLKDKVDAKKFIKKAFEEKLLLVGAGENTIRLLPPLNISYEEIDKAVDYLEKIIKYF